ncbi:MAG: hypothetical protein QOE48_6071 [Mycobacterium sp.]|nr:hypothetical protein [Mycobacterium sp.]
MSSIPLCGSALRDGAGFLRGGLGLIRRGGAGRSVEGLELTRDVGPGRLVDDLADALIQRGRCVELKIFESGFGGRIGI